jgi:TolB-like protein
MGMGMCSLVGERSGTSPNLPRGECCAATIDEKSDVWGAGTVLNQLFSVWLRKCDTSAAVWQGEFSERQRFALTAILARCVSASPTDRYPDAVELEKAMDLLGIKSYLRGWGRDEQPNRSESYKQVSYWRQSSRRTAIRKVTTATLMCVVVMVVAGATQWVSRPRGLEAVCRLGVLPVECPSGDQECEAMGHALTSSLGTRLVKTGGLELVPVDISSKFKGKRPPVLQVASRLKADYLLTGTIEKRAEARRFSARIIRVADHSLEWAGHFECSWNTLLEIQSQLLSDVLVVVNRKRPALTRLRPPESFSAQTAEDHELYARARHAVDTLVTVRERVYFDSAEKQLQSVLKSNPEFNDARILLAQLYYQEIWGSPQRSRLLENSRFLLEAAIQREPGRAEAHALLGGVFAETGQKQRGIEFARRALTLGPLESTPHRELAKLYAEAGFFEAALVEEDRALALDPSNLTALTLKILLLSWMGKQAEADAALWVLREWQPEGLANRLEADRELRTGNYAAASHLIAAALKHAGNPVNTQSSELARYLCAVLGGERSEARKAFRKHPDQPPRFFDHYILLAAQLGDARRVVDYIRHNPMYFNYRYLATEPRLSPVRNEPAFQALLKETYSRWQGDLARYGPSLPALPEPLPHPAGTSRTAVMAGLTPR